LTFTVNPDWLFYGKDPVRKGNYRTGEGLPFSSSHEQDDNVDTDLMWKVFELIGLDLKALPEEKRIIIRYLLYTDPLQKNRYPDLKYASLLCRLATCPTCEENKSKERWGEK
jgi:hypothetical protein